MSEIPTRGKTLLEQISTHWPLINDPMQFVMRYASAIQRYLSALLPNPDEREDVVQDFLVRVLERGFAEEQVTRGRFRDYLKAAVRNAALTYLRRRRPAQAGDTLLASLVAPARTEEADRAWAEQWRQTLLDQAWDQLEQHERQHPASLCHTVLRLRVDQPGAASDFLAAEAAQRTGRPLSPEAYRKQLSRSRKLFAEILLEEVRRTLAEPIAARVEEELADLGLLEYVRDRLPDP
jgi:RNA polymerase sigma-70 factor (ECF subfamily)